MIRIKILITFLICFCFLLRGQNSNNIRNTDKSDYVTNKFVENQDSVSLVNAQKENFSKSVDIFLAIGYTPFKLNGGIGYFFTNNIEANLQYSALVMPISFDIDVLSLGMRFYKNNLSTVYSISIGGTFSNKYGSYSLNGISIEGSLGFLFETNVGFYFLPSLKVGDILQKHKNSYGMAGIDLIIGWYIK